MELHLHFCSNQHGYALTQKINDFLLPLQTHQISRETLPEIAYGAAIYDEGFTDEGFKRS